MHPNDFPRNNNRIPGKSSFGLIATKISKTHIFLNYRHIIAYKKLLFKRKPGFVVEHSYQNLYCISMNNGENEWFLRWFAVVWEENKRILHTGNFPLSLSPEALPEPGKLSSMRTRNSHEKAPDSILLLESGALGIRFMIPERFFPGESWSGWASGQAFQISILSPQRPT